ncbi:hypothetical protein LMTR13_07710 [Bradyrhizobium icense]|uniref:Uncharacterized protein n=2 Tax=Bradyrhizobium icense TaxID=1274631 RepID=A0A1B1UBN2_9BRAD|nr:hypothetical protein LMTR13_07710 [Bradyrhizobium icense]
MNSTAGLFDWMMDSFSFQGISDNVAYSFIESNGNATWRKIKSQLAAQPTCPLLPSYWTFEGCRYDKTSKSCSQPNHLASCPLPSHPLRNGRLNQTAFSLYLFIRDQTKSDLVGWIDERLEETGTADCRASQEALIGPMRHIFGVSDKVLAMSLSTVLMADRANRPRWFDIGSQMIVVDTLVHNFLKRTGILAAFEAAHVYGPKCYQHGGCSEILRRAAECIDARAFNNGFPQNFPRLIQHALWRYCAADELDICNANNTNDTQYCTNNTCDIYSICRRNSNNISKSQARQSILVRRKVLI